MKAYAFDALLGAILIFTSSACFTYVPTCEETPDAPGCVASQGGNVEDAEGDAPKGADSEPSSDDVVALDTGADVDAGVSDGMQDDVVEPSCIVDADCAAQVEDACSLPRCQAGLCTTVAAGDGTSCDDGLACTHDDGCMAGTCAGTPITCPSPARNCASAVCSEAESGCFEDLSGCECVEATDCGPQHECSGAGTCVCVPDCEVKTCGGDGCGGSCGSCEASETCTTEGQCVCQPDCAGKQCGDDGCGGTCGTCGTGQACTAAGQCVCQPDCAGKQCGDDGCGGTCGTCGTGQACTAAGQCVCQPDCADKQCGDDGCGGTCGSCGTGQACTAAGQCVCQPDCAGMQCGDDGCGGTCGTCGTGQACTAAGQCVCQPDCADKQCGDNGCGGLCGACTGGLVCNAQGQCSEPPCGKLGVPCPDGFTCTGSGTCESATEVFVPAGPFWMGCNLALDGACDSGELPQHEVDVPGFAIWKTEVMAANYKQCVNAGGCTGPISHGDPYYSERATFPNTAKQNHPMNFVDWSQAVKYCQWMDARLCTEAEWEKAARGGCEQYPGELCSAASAIYPWGNDAPSCAVAHYDQCGTLATVPAASFPAAKSPYGALGMAGNVWEWVEDCDHWTYDGAPTDGSAWITECSGSGVDRIQRGGSFFMGASFLRASTRWQLNIGAGDVGFRCCRSM